MKGFSGDTHLYDEFTKLHEKYQFDLTVETGTFKGDTTGALLDISDGEVMTFEVNKAYFNEAKKKLLNEKTKHRLFMILGSSGTELYRHVKAQYIEKPLRCCFFLDAHWYSYNPLLDELKQIGKLYKEKLIKSPVILIHDFKNPNDQTMGYDEYPGIVYDWDYIEQAVHNGIYKHGPYTKRYNKEATGARRGVIILEPTKL